jgi:uncharacterized protein YukE
MNDTIITNSVNNLQRAINTLKAEVKKIEDLFRSLKSTLAPAKNSLNGRAVSAFETWAVLRDFWQLEQSACSRLIEVACACAQLEESAFRTIMDVVAEIAAGGDNKLLAEINATMARYRAALQAAGQEDRR